MVIIKALLAGLAVVSLCMANISGIVTDTGTTPIPGVIVMLEKGGQTATTGVDGRFTLIVSNAILPGNGKLLPIGLYARISGNMLNVSVAEHAAVEVATFDLNGKALSLIRQTINAGTHSIALPYQGAGIYLYKVKAGNNEFVLIGNAVGGISYGSSVTSQGSSSKPLAKQVMSTAAINDVLTVTKTGYLNYRMIVKNSDTSGIEIKMIASAGTVADIDGNVYQTVKIGNQEWTVENLRVTRYNDGTPVPFDTSTSTWKNIETPMFCYYGNTTNADSIKKYGALYTWYVVSSTNLKKIAPAGWHMPSDTEWTILENYLITKGYNWDGTFTGNKIAKSLAAKTDWRERSTTGTIGCDLTMNNRSGFSALPGGYRSFDGNFYNQSNSGFWWSASESGASFAWLRYLSCDLDYLYRNSIDKGCGFLVRLVKDN